MADILIDLPDDVVERLERRAASKGRSLEQELHEIVLAAAPSAPLGRAERLEIIDRYLSRSGRSDRHNSTDFIRKDRER